MGTSKVAVVKATPDTVHEDIARLMKLAECENCLDRGNTTILKDNISWHFPFPGANTTPWQLEGTIKALRELGFDDLVAVHNNTVVTNPYKGGVLNKLTPLYRRHAIPEKFNFVDGDVNWIEYSPKTDMLILDTIFPKGIRIPDFFVGKNIIHLPTLKCHIYTTTTGAMKNAFGGLLNTKRHYTHSRIHETLVDLLAIQKEIHPGVFAVMDGTTAGNGPGPRTMKPVQADYLLASCDQVAIDAVAAKMMGFDPMSLKYIRLAHERGLGTGAPEEIELVGEEITSVNLQFSVGDNLASMVGDMFWFGPLKIFQRLLFRTPLVYVFVFGSSFYHDWLWWPLKGKRVLKKWRQESAWGRLFDSLCSIGEK